LVKGGGKKRPPNLLQLPLETWPPSRLLFGLILIHKWKLAMADTNRKPFQFTADDVRVERQESCYKGFFRMDKVYLSHARFAGGFTETIGRELFMRGDATCVLPYDPVRDEVVLLEQFRPGALWRDQSPWLLELVAGMNEPGESPEDVAAREAEEEAGLSFSRLEKICTYLVSPGGTTEMVSLYCGQASTEGAGGLYGVESENEDICAHVLSADEALRMIADGRINNAPTIMALQWLSLHRSRLRREWPE
jgi:ADP-ribose pyrophosphatase